MSMAPSGAGKRKRGDRSYSGDSRDEGTRPSPHRPDQLSMAQRTQQYPPQPHYGRGGYNDRGRGNRRGSRGGMMPGSHRSPVSSPTSAQAAHPSFEHNKPLSPQNQPSVPSVPQSFAHNQVTTGGPPKFEEQRKEEPPLKLPPMEYEHLTESVVESWSESGRGEVLSTCLQARDAQDFLILTDVFQEVVRACAEKRIEAEAAGVLIKEILTVQNENEPVDETDQDTSSDTASLFLDALSVFVETFSFSPMFTTLVQHTAISPFKIRRELDTTLLESLGLIRNTFTRIGIRQQTNLLYRQSNYNLLREETEGYSKLVTEFFTTSNNESPTSEVVEETFERVRGMIGAFDLDVGRVLDITLDVFAAVLVKQYSFFVKYLRASSWWPQNDLANLEASEKSLGPLPRWALPGFERRTMTDEEKEATSLLKTQRDVKFWRRCKDVGMPAFFEIGGREVAGSVLDNALAQLNSQQSSSSEETEDHKWIRITRTLPPIGNKVAAQVLGFKLRFYISSARDSSDTFPVNLIYLAALLIKIGFVSLRDLYPHIWPEDSSFSQIREVKMKEKLEKEKLSRPGGGTNALLAAAPLPDDTIEPTSREATRLREADAARRQKADASSARLTPSAQVDEKPEELPEPTDQKVQLLKSLLSIGALPEALYMLGRFPWLPEAFPELPEYIHRILHHCISNVYDSLRPLKDENGLQAQQKYADTEQVGVPKGQVRLADMPVRRTLRWALLDKDDASEFVDYRFYWDDWADTIPVCQDFDDVFTLCSTLLSYSGVKIGQDPALLTKLARIGRHSLSTDSSESNLARWIDLSKRLLVPALSLTKCNPGVVNEVFELIKHFSESTRYGIYAEWNIGSTSRMPDIKAAFEQTKAETRDVLKRISKTTVKPMGRALARVSYPSPGVVFSVAISQLESYENIVDTFVECARYFTYLAYDVLTWSLMSSLGAQGRNRLQSDGILTSKWLASLALFAGKVFKRYSVMNPLPIVQYVEHQLRKGNPTDLIILEELTKSMAGVISDVNFSEAQVLGMGGGKLIRMRTLEQLMDRRKESEGTAKRLIKPLVESQLAGQVLVSLALERQTCIFRVDEGDAHPKLLGNVFDQIQRILGQYLELLRSSLSVTTFDEQVPDVIRLIGDLEIDPSVAFWISRDSISTAIKEYDIQHPRPVQTLRKTKKDSFADSNAEGLQPMELVEGSDVQQKADSTTEPDKTNIPNNNNIINTVMLETDAEATVPAPIAETSTTQPSKSEEAVLVEGCHPVLQPVASHITPYLPSKLWEVVEPSFYVTFWQSSLQDIVVPAHAYSQESIRINETAEVIKKDQTDISLLGSKKKQDRAKELGILSNQLLDEMKALFDQVNNSRLKIEKDHWFTGGRKGMWRCEARHNALIEHCFFPRIVMSPVDSLFTYNMIKWMHNNGAAVFRAMGLYDQFFREKRLTSMIFMCSSKEAECLGRFLNYILQDFAKWHASRASYEKDALGVKTKKHGFHLLMYDKENDVETEKPLEFEDFRRILLKWHRNLNGALKACYASGEYMHIRNAINVLNHVVQYFPAINWMGSNQMSLITDLSNKETREDLKIAATSLISALKKREKQWILPQAFSLQNEGGQSGNRPPRSSSVQPTTPQPGTPVPKALNPKAPDFMPAPENAGGEVTLPSTVSGKNDSEDGEINDIPPIDKDASTTEPEDAKDTAVSVSQDAASIQIKGSAHIDGGQETPKTTSDSSGNPQTTPSSNHNQPAGVDTLPQPVKSTSTPPILNGKSSLPPKPDPTHRRQPDLLARTRPDDRPPGVQARDLRSSGRGMPESERGPERVPSNLPPRAPPSDNRYTRPLPDDGYRHPHEGRHISNDRSNRVPPGPPIIDPDPRHDHAPVPRSRDFSGTSAPHTFTSGSQPPARNTSVPSHSGDGQDTYSRYHGDRQTHPGQDWPSRGSSPTRGDNRSHNYDRTKVQSDHRHTYDDRPTHGRYDDSNAPTAPRNDRPPMGPLANSHERFRDTRAHPQAPSTDPNYGRLRHDQQTSRQPENFGRLNAENDIPAGPRMTNGAAPPPTRGARTANVQHPSSSQQPAGMSQTSAALPPINRQVPNGAAVRSSPRNANTFNPNASAANTSSVQAADTTGIHPDRLKAIQGGPPAIPVNPGPIARGGVRPPPGEIPPQPQEMQRTQDEQYSAPPGPATGSRGPPTGPSDRRGDKRFTGLQSVLQQSNSQGAPDRNQQGTSIRGRGARNAPPSTSGPPTPSASFPPQESFGRSNGPVPLANDDNAQFSRNFRSGPQDTERRSTRHRSHSPTGRARPDFRNGRENEMQPTREDARNRFHNDGPPLNARGGSGSGPDMRGGGPPVSMGRELRSGPPRRGDRDEPPQPPDRRDIQDWSGDRRGPMGRRGDDRDGRDGGGSLRKRGRADEGYSDRGMDSKRPRRGM